MRIYQSTSRVLAVKLFIPDPPWLFSTIAIDTVRVAPTVKQCRRSRRNDRAIRQGVPAAAPLFLFRGGRWRTREQGCCFLRAVISSDRRWITLFASSSLWRSWTIERLTLVHRRGTDKWKSGMLSGHRGTPHDVNDGIRIISVDFESNFWHTVCTRKRFVEYDERTNERICIQ